RGVRELEGGRDAERDLVPRPAEQPVGAQEQQRTRALPAAREPWQLHRQLLEGRVMADAAVELGEEVLVEPLLEGVAVRDRGARASGEAGRVGGRHTASDR